MVKNIQKYIDQLPIGQFAPLELGARFASAPVADLRNLPRTTAVGSNLLELPEQASPEVRESIALSMLLAQLAASNQPGVSTPDEWINMHNQVLRNLQWVTTAVGYTAESFQSINVAVHEAIIPFLATAFSGGTAGALILAVLKQLNEMDKDSPWISLFDRESRRFDALDSQYSAVGIQNGLVELHLAQVRFTGEKQNTQVLFWKWTKEIAKFLGGRAQLSIAVELITRHKQELEEKLDQFTSTYIRDVNIGPAKTVVEHYEQELMHV